MHMASAPRCQPGEDVFLVGLEDGSSARMRQAVADDDEFRKDREEVLEWKGHRAAACSEDEGERIAAIAAVGFLGDRPAAARPSQ